MGWQNRQNQYPGRGPFSNLPPWQRPGRGCGGRGYGRRYNVNPNQCARYPNLPRWWWANSITPQKLPTPIPQNEISTLEECKKQLEDEKTSIEQEINSLEAHLKELKTATETDKKQPDQQ
jgi:hypothetical protein